MNKEQMVLFAIGPDRPGLVMEISSIIHQCGANLEDSRMAILAGDFALIVLFSGHIDAVEEVQLECKRLEERLHVQMLFKKASESKRDTSSTAQFCFRATGTDQPGIVHHMSAILAKLGINVVSLESKLVPAAFQGVPLFSVQATIDIPLSIPLEELKDKLDTACEALDLSLELELVS